MATREAACHCGQLRLEVTGDPFAVSDLQLPRLPAAEGKRLRDAGGIQGRSGAGRRLLQRLLAHLGRGRPEGARLPLLPRLRLAGLLQGADGAGSRRRLGGLVADPSFPPPTESGYDSRRHAWVGLPDSIRRNAPELWWESALPLYEAGKYAEAADRGRELVETRPDQPYLYYNVACCESLAGRVPDAVEHLRRAIEMWEGCRDMAKEDSDFDPLRDEPAFRQLIG